MRIDVLPVAAIRGAMIKGERPDEIAIVFNRKRIETIFINEATKQKFLKWLQVAVYYALKPKENGK